MKNIGWIGFGNMAQAIAKGWIRSGKVEGAQMIASARDREKLQCAAEPLGIRVADSNEDVVAQADLIVVAVKPAMIEDVLSPLKEKLSGKPVLSIAAGWNHERYRTLLGDAARTLSVMPNLPVEVGDGIVLCDRTHSLHESEYAAVTELLSHLGYVATLDAMQADAGGTLAGCGPAFAAMVMEALADGAVKHGLSRKNAYELAARVLIGTAKLQLETGVHPAVIKDGVCSPGGTTIKGVAALEREGLRHALISALDEILSQTGSR